MRIVESASGGGGSAGPGAGRDGDVLFLSQRLPYPPNKGDKIRSWNFFRHLAARHAMHLGCFVDDPADWQPAEEIRALCASAAILPLDPRRQKPLSLAQGLATGEALTLPYFRARAMRDFVRRTIAERRPKLVFVFSSSMAQYLMDVDVPGARLVLDMVDVDSLKWAQYAGRKKWPLSAIYRRESRLLKDFEIAATRRFDRTLLVSAAEAKLFRELAPALADRIGHIENGVDTKFFDPATAHPSPFPAGTRAIVFTGMMNYWPNVDAVTWLAEEVWPKIRARRADCAFYIVGASPSPAVTALGRLPGVTVTGRVPDVRPYLAHAALAAAPLRVAQGIQNKVLEAMSMRLPVVVTPAALEGIAATPGTDLLLADDAAEFAAAALSLIEDPARAAGIGAAGRALIDRRYTWSGKLQELDRVCT